MLYPILPLYLKTIGFSIVLIGVLEGVAEATAGLSKGYFGRWSDVSGRRVPFVQLGYALSSLSRPMMAVLVYPLWIFAARTLDRFGKGLRTGARDAMLSAEATPATKGEVFGFHRSMDTLGAVFGPSLALLYLYFYPGHYKTLFYIALVPGLLAVLASFLLKENNRTPAVAASRVSLFSFAGYWKQSPVAYRQVVMGLLVFALFNSSDVFLLLQARQAGLSDSLVIGVYIFYNLVYALFAFPMGKLADRAGLQKIIILGLALFAAVYIGMATGQGIGLYMVLFMLYGLYAAATEGISKAWISSITDKKDTATAIGTFAGLQSICTMMASALTGLIWHYWGATMAFTATGVVTLLVMVYFMLLPAPKGHQEQEPVQS